ncbi:transketolase-like TK C-terminal-containing protein [Salibacterium aidingense]|uniref:transketolase-like TK C-terminal-containing protein n=1 Tax=Salibacterium aidingense TaxID=384933 RepID=UPI003BE4ACA1
MASPLGWERYTGDHGKVFGIETFGASAPGSVIMKEYGFTAENIVKQIKHMLVLQMREGDDQNEGHPLPARRINRTYSTLFSGFFSFRKGFGHIIRYSPFSGPK